MVAVRIRVRPFRLMMISTPLWRFREPHVRVLPAVKVGVQNVRETAWLCEFDLGGTQDSASGWGHCFQQACLTHAHGFLRHYLYLPPPVPGCAARLRVRLGPPTCDFSEV